jgi:xanthine/uracil/vitamin C permease (AzgA family)
VIPQQLSIAGYSEFHSVVTTALCCGIGSAIGGLFMNLPFIIAPPTVVSIYLVVFLQEKELGPQFGNASVIMSGFALMFFGYRPLANFVGTLIPLPIQVGTLKSLYLIIIFYAFFIYIFLPSAYGKLSSFVVVYLELSSS